MLSVLERGAVTEAIPWPDGSSGEPNLQLNANWLAQAASVAPQGATGRCVDAVPPICPGSVNPTVSYKGPCYQVRFETRKLGQHLDLGGVLSLGPGAGSQPALGPPRWRRYVEI